MDVTKSTKQLMPIAQSNDTKLGTPRNAKGKNAGASTTKAKQETVSLAMDVAKSTKQLMPIAQYNDTNPGIPQRSISTMTKKEKHPHPVVNNSEQLMPIAQYNDTNPGMPKRSISTKIAKHPHPLSFKSKRHEPESMPEPCPQPAATTASDRRSRINPRTASNSSKDKSGPRRRSTSTRRPSRLETKTNTRFEDSSTSPRSPRGKSGLRESRKTRLQSNTTKEDSQTSGEPTDETTKSHKLDASCNTSFNQTPKSYLPRLQQPGEKFKIQERKQAVNKGLDKFLQMVADNEPVSKIKDDNRSVYSAIPELERMRKMAKGKQRDKRRFQRRDDPDPNNESVMNMSVGSMPAMDMHAGNISSSSGMDHRPVISLRKTHFSKKLRNLDLTF
jgi:hypothetical protein